MKKPIVKKSIAKFIKKVRPFSMPALVGAAGVSAIFALDSRKKSKQKKEIKISRGQEYAFREGMRASLDLKAAGHSSKEIKNISKNYIGVDFGTRQKGYEAKKTGFSLWAKDKPRQIGRNIKGGATKGNKYIIYDL